MLITDNTDFNVMLLSSAMCMSAIAGVIILIVLLKNRVGGHLAGGIICLLFGSSLTLLCLDLVVILSQKFYGDALLLLQLLCLIGLAVAVWILRSFYVRWESGKPSRSNVGVWGIGIVSLAVSFLCSNRIHALGITDVTLLTNPELPGEVKPIDTHYAISDRGRHITLHYFDLKGDLPHSNVSKQFVNNSFPGAVILRKDADLSANCHGWVFANGEFLVNTQGVSIILEDNDYTRVDFPEEGDVVIYRNSRGNPVHTAIVCARLPDGSILVESKWGVHQRFIHLAEDQPYSAIIEYYRSPRSGHTIQIRNADGSVFEPGSQMSG